MKKSKLLVLSGLAMLTMAFAMSCSNPAGGDTTPAPTPTRSVPEIFPAILADKNDSKLVLVDKDSYKVSITADAGANDYIVNVEAKNLVQHTNAKGNAGRWIGFAMKNPANATQFNYYSGETKFDGTYTDEKQTLEKNVDGKDATGVALYLNKNLGDKFYRAIEWLDKDGKSLGKYAFTIDLSKVESDIEGALKDAIKGNKYQGEEPSPLFIFAQDAKTVDLQITSGEKFTYNLEIKNDKVIMSSEKGYYNGKAEGKVKFVCTYSTTDDYKTISLKNVQVFDLTAEEKEVSDEEAKKAYGFIPASITKKDSTVSE